MGNPVQDSAKGAKQLAIDIAKKAAREPLEILKESGKQTLAPVSETGQKKEEQNSHNSEESSAKTTTETKEPENKRQDSQRLQALEREIKQILSERIYKEIMQRILDGEKVSLTDIPELSVEQKQVLAAQMEVVEQRKLAQEEKQRGGVLDISSKPSRKFLGLGAKQSAQKQTTRVERPLPPSG